MTGQPHNDMPAQPLKTIAELGCHIQQKTATALARAGDFPCKPSRMNIDFESRLEDGIGSCVTQNVGKNKRKYLNLSQSRGLWGPFCGSDGW